MYLCIHTMYLSSPIPYSSHTGRKHVDLDIGNMTSAVSRIMGNSFAAHHMYNMLLTPFPSHPCTWVSFMPELGQRKQVPEHTKRSTRDQKIYEDKKREA